ncbi:hypothetical protein RIF29_14017 [Crotalaria pallida]|uniref:Uncharacterized protein n=1 Tax=Crotalaria pallida TaxID=3830 RepID=A0AAN9FAM2_CROPI
MSSQRADVPSQLAEGRSLAQIASNSDLLSSPPAASTRQVIASTHQVVASTPSAIASTGEDLISNMVDELTSSEGFDLSLLHVREGTTPALTPVAEEVKDVSDVVFIRESLAFQK